MRKISWPVKSCYSPFWQDSHSTPTHSTLTEMLYVFSLCVVAEFSAAPTNSRPLALSIDNTPRTAPSTLPPRQDYLLVCRLYILWCAVFHSCNDCPGSSHDDRSSPTNQRVCGVVQVSLEHCHCNTKECKIAAVNKNSWARKQRDC